MKRIFKYPLHEAIEIPEGAKILCVQVQRNEPTIWAIIDDEKPMENRVFRIVGTGHTIDFDTKNYIGTVQLLNGNLVFHVFEI